MKIAFTTLGCPDWSWEKVVNEASSMGFDGIELRGVEGEMFLPKAKPFLPENFDSTLADLMRRGLEICCLDTSCKFHDESSWDKAIEEGKASIDLAQKLGTPFIRVFGDKVPDPDQREVIIDQVARGLIELGSYAEGKGVEVLLETHGDFSGHEIILEVFEKINNRAVGIVWDFEHPYIHAGEEVSVTYDKLGSYIKHTHVKDSRGKEQEKPLCLIGQGKVPIMEAVAILKQNGYNGWYSLEWEKKWQTYLEDPEEAFPSYIRYMKNIT